MAEPMTLDQASVALRDAMRATVKRHAWLFILQGVMMILAGAVALLFPLFSTFAVAFVIGWMLVLAGLVQALSLIGASQVPHFWLQLISVVLTVLIGLLFIRDPGAGVGTLTLLLIVFFMVEGIAKIVFSLTIRPFPKWGWVLASGALGVVLSLVLLANPIAAVWFLGILIGIQLISEGGALAFMAWEVKKAEA